MTPALLRAAVVPLEEARDPARVGGKAARLGDALRRGLPVPPGVAIEVAARPERLDAVDPALLDAVQAELERRAPLAAGWIVRSSGAGEDGAAASFAGQLDSVAGVTTREALAAALATVWASDGSARARGYQAALGVRLRGVGVVVQAQVPARAAGVLFTRHPGRADVALGEWVLGPSAPLVQGEADPARFVVPRAGGPPVHEPSGLDPAALGDAPAAMAAAGRLLERSRGVAQDLEWVVDPRGRWWLVQARDVVAPRAAPGPRTRWSNANIAENFPGPVTPFLHSFVAHGYYHLFRGLGAAFGVSERRLQAVEHPLRRAVGLHAGRLYYDLTAIHEVLAAAPLGDRLAALFDRYVGAAAPAAAPMRALELAELARVAACVLRCYADLEGRVARFERTVAAYAAATAPAELARRDLAGLVRDLRGAVDLRARWTDAGLADTAAMVTSGLLGRLVAGAVAPERRDAVEARLLAGLDELVSAAPVEALWRVAERTRGAPAALAALAEPDDRAALAALERAAATDGAAAAALADLRGWIEAWGHRRSGELLLTVPTLEEEPWRAVALLRAYLRGGGEPPASRLARQAAARRAATDEVARAAGRARGALLRRVLGWTWRAIALRERARQRQALLYARLRRVVLALGARLAAAGLLERGDDAFFLSWQELDALASGGGPAPAAARALVRLRREEHRADGELRPPDLIELAPGERPDTSTWRAPAVRPRPGVGATELTGLGAQGGRVMARARVLEHSGDVGRLGPGEVLVTRQTDPGWAPALFLARGLVVERGGLLSHGAIVAREYGLPTVIGVRDATALVPDGRAVTVDGDLGRVTVHEAAP